MLSRLYSVTSPFTRFFHAVDAAEFYASVLRWCRDNGCDFVICGGDKVRVLATEHPTFLNAAEISVVTAARVAEVIVGGESVRTSDSWRGLLEKAERRAPYGRAI